MALHTTALHPQSWWLGRVQELLAVSGDRVDLVDLRTRNTGHRSHACATQGLQLLPTPDSSMLVVLGHGDQGWCLQVLPLPTSCVSMPPRAHVPPSCVIQGWLARHRAGRLLTTQYV